MMIDLNAVPLELHVLIVRTFAPANATRPSGARAFLFADPNKARRVGQEFVATAGQGGEDRRMTYKVIPLEGDPSLAGS